MISFAWERLKNFTGTICIVVVCSVLISVTDLSIPFLTAKFIDEILATGNREEFYRFILLMFTIMITAIAAHYSCTILSKKILLSTAKALSEEILRHVHKLGGEFIFKTDMIYLSKRVDKDATDLMTFIVNSTVDVCLNFVMLLMAVGLLFSIGIKWMLIFFVVAALHLVAYKILDKTLFERSTAVRESNSKYFTGLADNFIYAYSIKLHCLNEKFLAAFDKTFGEYFSATLSETRIKFWFTSTELNSGDVFRIVVFLLGGTDVLNGEMTIGNLVALIGYYMFAMQGVSYFMSFGQNWQNALAAYVRITEIKNLPPDINGTKILSRINSIEVCGVDFAFGEQKILTNFSRRFERGKMYCVVGKNGAGKSTLMNLICGMIRPDGGEIFLDGVSLREVDMIHARKNLIAVVEQKDFIRNDKLSGGERRKASIATAFAKSADVLIMDEPDNNLDAQAVDALTKKILADKANRITLIISHDERLIDVADEVLTLTE